MVLPSRVGVVERIILVSLSIHWVDSLKQR
jgi:hypothetical protein